MFLRKLTVLLVPLAMLMVLCLLAPLFYAMSPYFGSLLQGALLGVLLALLLPLSGATRLREPFAWLLWVPAAVILLILSNPTPSPTCPFTFLTTLLFISVPPYRYQSLYILPWIL